MCRYSFQTYKGHFACFACRKVFKKVPFEDYLEHTGQQTAYDKLFRAYRHRQDNAAETATFKAGRDKLIERYLADVSTCPQCGQRMAEMGLDFRAPPMRDQEAWAVVEALYEHGFKFFGCGCQVGYAPPSRLSDLKAWLAERAKPNAGEKLLAAIAARAS